MLLNFSTFSTAPDFSLHIKFSCKYIFLYKLKNSLKAYFLWYNSYISTDLLNKQKQPFAEVLQNRYSSKFRNNHMKTPESLFNKVTDLKVCNLIKQRLQHRRFHVNIAKFLRTAFLIKHLRSLLLNKVKTNVKSTWFILLPDWLYYQGRIHNEYVSSASFNVKKCPPPWLTNGKNFWF